MVHPRLHSCQSIALSQGLLGHLGAPMFLVEPGSKWKFTCSKEMTFTSTDLPTCLPEGQNRDRFLSPNRMGGSFQAVSSSASMPGMHQKPAFRSSPRMQASSASCHSGHFPILFLLRLISSCTLNPWAQQAVGKQLQVTQLVCGQGELAQPASNNSWNPKTDSPRNNHQLAREVGAHGQLPCGQRWVLEINGQP